jgi:predicted O-methyltransferase YrrM
MSILHGARKRLVHTARRLAGYFRREPPAGPVPRRPKKSITRILAELDEWVSQHGKDGYVPEDFVPLDGHGYDHGIQQVRREIHAFARLLDSRNLHGTLVEIGLGNYGGTHMLWRNLFDRVITIDNNPHLIPRFKQREALDERSVFIYGCSQDPQVVAQVHALAQGAEVVFIDGDHEYEAVSRDWSLYKDLVRPGGVLAFHDSVCTQEHFGVVRFLRELANGTWDGRAHRFNHIVYSTEVGIAYEII